MSFTYGLKTAVGLAGLALALGCGGPKAEQTSDRSPTEGGTSNIVGKTDRGSLSLRMPQDKRGHKTKKLRIVLEGTSDCAYTSSSTGTGYVEGETTGDEGTVDAANAEDKRLDLHAVAEDDDAEYYDDEEVNILPDECNMSYAEYFYDFQPGKEIEITDVAPGWYNVTVQLLDRKEEVLEQGSSGALVEAGQSAYVQIVLGEPNGSLIIDIIRKDEWQPEPYPYPMPCGEIAWEDGQEKPAFDHEDGNEGEGGLGCYPVGPDFPVGSEDKGAVAAK